MTKKEYCLKNPAVAYYSGFCGLEIHGVEYGINDYLYCVSGAWGGKVKTKLSQIENTVQQQRRFCPLAWVQSVYERMYKNGALIMGTTKSHKQQKKK